MEKIDAVAVQCERMTHSLLIPCSYERKDFVGSVKCRAGSVFPYYEAANEHAANAIFPVYFPDTGNFPQRRVS